MAKPYKEGKGWSVRLRVRSQDVYLSGLATAAAATKEAARQRQHIEDQGKPARQGPERTSVAVALQDYARERLPFLKGAAQEARRINRYLRAAGQDIAELTPVGPRPDIESGPATKKPGKANLPKKNSVHWQVRWVPAGPQRVIPQGLAGHRASLAHRTSRSDTLRARLACTPMARVTALQVQELMQSLQTDGCAASTVHLERATLRALFYYATEVWCWSTPVRNPASGIKMPVIDNQRNRVFSDTEWGRLEAALEECQNELIAPGLTLLRETAMRASEALTTATWGCVDWEQKTLHLATAKAGSRDVPLSPLAIKTLEAMPRGEAHEPILGMTYEALKAAWLRACARAGLEDAHLHDLRHTAATRFALGPGQGNLFLVMAFTGHKTASQVMRYVNVKVGDVVRAMHGPAEKLETPAETPLTAATDDVADAGADEVTGVAISPLPSNVVQGVFGKRRAA